MVQTSRGKSVKTCALIDSGSQATLALERFASQIGLEGKEEVLNIGTVNSKKYACRSKRISFAVSSTVKTNNKWLAVDEAWTIPRLNLPEQKVTNSLIQSWPHLANLEIPEVDSKDVTMLLGANVVEAVLHHEVRKGATGSRADRLWLDPNWLH